MRHIRKLVAVAALAASTALLPVQSAEARGGRGIGLGIAGAVIGSALLAGSYGYGRGYGYGYGPSYYSGGPSYVYGSSYYYPRWRHRHHRHHRHWGHHW